MFENHSCNMRPVDSHIRTTIATILLIYAVINSSIIIGTIRKKGDRKKGDRLL